jgi:hypothetical protein
MILNRKRKRRAHKLKSIDDSEIEQTKIQDAVFTNESALVAITER